MLNKILLYLYPNSNRDMQSKDYRIEYNSITNTQVISYWNEEKLGPQPTQEELDAALPAAEKAWELKLCQRQRRAEYPSIEDYLDGVVKGDQAQIQEYIDKCLAVKAKYPKP